MILGRQGQHHSPTGGALISSEGEAHDKVEPQLEWGRWDYRSSWGLDGSLSFPIPSGFILKWRVGSDISTFLGGYRKTFLTTPASRRIRNHGNRKQHRSAYYALTPGLHSTASLYSNQRRWPATSTILPHHPLHYLLETSFQSSSSLLVAKMLSICFSGPLDHGFDFPMTRSSVLERVARKKLNRTTYEANRAW